MVRAAGDLAEGGFYSEEDLLPLSALQHLIFCERQAALIHLEGLWADNRLTVEGSHLHRKADTGPGETRRNIRIARGVRLRSLRLGLVGKADVVEFHRLEASPVIKLSPGIDELVAADWRPFPVEYKRGRPKRHSADEVQLCAQALCLEEMFGVSIAAGALFYGQTRRRQDVAFSDELRAITERAASRMHEIIRSGVTPRARRQPKCESCSLKHLCLPAAADPGRSVQKYLQRSLRGLNTSG